MYAKILRILCLLLILLAFIAGTSISINKKPTILEGAKLTVIDSMYHPYAAYIRSIEFFAGGSKMSSKAFGNVCGEVFTFKDGNPYKYKRFIVQVASNREGEFAFSMPLIDFEGEMIPEVDFQQIWEVRCK